MRKLMENEREALLQYISAEPEQTLFIYGDIEVYGLAGDIVEVFCEDLPSGGYDFVLLRYLDSYVFYSHHTAYNAEAVAAWVTKHGFDVFSGKAQVAAKAAALLPLKSCQNTFLARMGAMQAAPSAALCKVRALQVEDAAAIFDLLVQIAEFGCDAAEREKEIAHYRQNLEKGGHAFGIFENDVLVSLAETSAENDISAMLIGVATLPSARGQGYATACVQKAAQFCFAAGRKYLCLFYDNPVAGKIYHKCGFEDIGEYLLAKSARR
ncbi:MAG: GNAT family N-acetyltransferase [Oscillospiraceae bacterium]|nr:GNAT family N-acetyltransferase [Oscillospiraceae bacterium]